MNDRMGRIHCIHFVGVGGVGMGGIAEVLLNLGYAVQGSDLSPNTVTARLESQGARVFRGHDAGNLRDADVVVVSSAVPLSNPEIVEAKRRRVPVVQRAEMLAELMRFRNAIAIGGTHGKTTTTGLLTHVLREADLDPGFLVGGVIVGEERTAGTGTGPVFCVEGDEYDAAYFDNFAEFMPTHGVVAQVAT